MTDQELMGLALQEAEKAAALGEVPVGAVVAKDGQRRYRAEADDKDGEHRQKDSRHMKETANGTACGKMTVNDAEYTVLKLLGKGKGGYCYGKY